MSLEEFKKQFAEYQVANDLPIPLWNIRPTNEVPVLLEDHKEDGLLRAESARWALTPTWSKTLKTKVPLFNARIETVFEKPSFKFSRNVAVACYQRQAITNGLVLKILEYRITYI